MRPIVECIPNLSEGRREPVIEAIVAAVRQAGATLLDVQSDAEQNRSVLRFAGEPVVVERAALALVAESLVHIDMRQHEGMHPRIGAVDVLPFVPISGIELEACVEMAKRVARRLARDHELPIYLYGAAADGRELASLRQGEYEELRERIAHDASRAPDFGPRRLGPGGACIVGARHPKVYALVRLDGADREAVERLAAAVDQATGGLTHVQAHTIEVPEEGLGLALTLDRIDESPLHRALYLLEAEARALGLRLGGTELVGHLPQRVLDDAAIWHLGLQGLREEQLIERRLALSTQPANPAESSPRAYVEALGSGRATPGGGSASALAGALSAALSGMVARLTTGRTAYAEVEEEMQDVIARAEALAGRLMTLMDADGEAFESVMAAYRMARGTSQEADARRQAIQDALREAARVPLQVMRSATELLELAAAAAERGNASAVSDAGVASILAQAAARGAALNVEINVLGLRDLEEGDRIRAEAAELLRSADRRAESIERGLRSRIGQQA